MIQASEVKVNNVFIRELRTSRGLEYDHDFILTEEQMGKLFGDNIGLALQDLFPIPLTPEILIAVGFKDMDGEFCPAYQLEQIEIEILPDDSYYARIKWDKDGASLFLADVKSLHQLQNLYFSLTNTELKYTP
jgi:hypothetical protein